MHLDASTAGHDYQRASLKPFPFNRSTFLIEVHPAIFCVDGTAPCMVLTAAVPGRMTQWGCHAVKEKTKAIVPTGNSCCLLSLMVASEVNSGT